MINSNYKKLGDICDFIGGSQPPKSDFIYDLDGLDKEQYVRLIQIRDYKSNKHVVYIKKSDTKKFCTKYDVMIGRYGPPLFQILRGLEGAYNVALMKAVPKTKELDRDYLFLFLQSSGIQEYVIGLSERAAGQTGVNKPALDNYPIFLPSIEEQKRIVILLNKTFSDVEKIKKNIETSLKNSKNLISSYLHQIFGKSSDGWDTKKIREILKLEYGKPLCDSLRKNDGKYPVYGANGIKDRSDDFYCNEKTIIVGRKGSAGELTLTEEKFWPLDVTYFVKLDSKKYDLIFVFHMLTYLNLPKLATGVKPGINRNAVYEISVNVPDINIQMQISEKINQLIRKIDSLDQLYKRKLFQLESFKKSILDKAFTGQLTTQEVTA